MQYPPSPENQKPSSDAEKSRKAFVARIDRAANDLNPVLIVVVLGLLLLNLTFYLGLAASHDNFVWQPAHQNVGDPEK